MRRNDLVGVIDMIVHVKKIFLVQMAFRLLARVTFTLIGGCIISVSTLAPLPGTCKSIWFESPNSSTFNEEMALTKT